jgi:Ca2+-transporting ATPase
LLPVLFGWPLLLTPMLIALLELIIDPACSVVLEAEPEEAGVMRRPPRGRAGALLPRPLLLWCLVQGALALAAVTAVFVAAVRAGLPADSVRTVAFLALVGVNIALIFVNRSFASSLAQAFGRPNKVLWWGLGIACAVLAIIVGWPGARRFFGLGALEPAGFAAALGAALALLVVHELLKRPWRRSLER